MEVSLLVEDVADISVRSLKGFEFCKKIKGKVLALFNCPSSVLISQLTWF